MPDLIADLRNDPLVQPLICEVCAENGFAADLSPEIGADNALIIKVDDYYNTVNFAKPLPAPDCLILVRCRKGHYDLYVVELKDINDPNRFDPINIREKFTTCLADFMQNILKSYFVESEYEFGRVELHFVTDPYGREPDRKGDTQKMDLLLTDSRPYYFRGKRYGLQHKRRSPLIQPC